MGTGQRGLHLQPVVQHALGKSAWPPSSVNMFGSCGPPSPPSRSPVPLYTGLWGSNGCTSPLGGTCHPALGAAGSFSVPWQAQMWRGWCAGARSQKDRLASVCSSRRAGAPCALLQMWAHLFLASAAKEGAMPWLWGKITEKESSGPIGAKWLGIIQVLRTLGKQHLMPPR